MNKGTMTRRMDSALNDLEREFKGMYTLEMLEYKFEQYKRAKDLDDSDWSSKEKELADMLISQGIECSAAQTPEDYRKLIASADVPKNSNELQDKLILAVYSKFQEYPSPEQYMKRIVDRLCNPEDGWQDDTLRLRILKQFIKYGEYLWITGIPSKKQIGGRTAIRDFVEKKIGKKPSIEEVLIHLDDTIFDKLKEVKDNKDDGKFTGGKYSLLKMADDLSYGKFRTNGSTKRMLYLFAMVYGMTYYSGNEANGEIIDYKSDIELNLFRDYYHNNLMRFLSEAYIETPSGFANPSGAGINYKNYAEMVYLYYISKSSEECSPAEKFIKSHDMIEDINAKMMDAEPSAETKKKDTQVYRDAIRYDGNDLFSEDVLEMDEEAFKQFLCENYDCRRGSNVGVMQLKTEQNSAFRVYQSILQDIEKLDVDLKNCNYGLWFVDVNAFNKEGYGKICERKTEIDPEKFDRFKKILEAMNKYVGREYKEDTKDIGRTELSSEMIGAMKITEPKDVTRSSLLIAFYYYYNAKMETYLRKGHMSFEEFFYEFKMEADLKLEEAYYQPFSGRTLFDLLIAFSAYSRLYL